MARAIGAVVIFGGLYIVVSQTMSFWDEDRIAAVVIVIGGIALYAVYVDVLERVEEWRRKRISD